MNSPTVVTGLFNINRHKFKNYKRDFEVYLKWFINCLSLDCNMIIFVEESLLDFVKTHRAHLPENKTKIICKKIEDFKFYKYKDRMKTIMDSINFEKELEGAVAADPTAPEYNEPLYNIITYSKVSMLREASEINPFNNDYFLWVDAGCMHNSFPKRFKKIKFPSLKNLNILDENKIYLTCKSKPLKSDLNLNTYLKKGYTTKFWAFVIGANKKHCLELENFFDSYIDEILNMNFINSEQSALTIYYLRNNMDIDKFNIKYITPYCKYGCYTGFTNLIDPMIQ